ncbi:prefoldin subunit alpha [Methanothermococcus okinawensis]|uniref:Prefoldin subunit alpha n=1 Tax=Methanothermococcus okinawensis (strain DSM 14208 / JCM 11175 / IH1) TaxID=647113 RepID=F8AJZ5_METOI|nr:prefoldin subunit alpha [Methanothermococcus okinawensis]AEH07351.1 Prefoldin subunit alpha [Methanothermococcus okinawensis IH1]
MTNEEIQKQFYELELYNQQVKKLQDELGKIEIMKMELMKSIESMNGLKESKEILIPLGGGAFVKAEVIDSENIIVGAGADVFLEKNIDEVVEDFKKSSEELTNAETMIKEQIEKTVKFMEKMQKDLEKKVKLMESQKQQTPTAPAQ